MSSPLDRYRERAVLAARDAVTTRLCEDTTTGKAVVIRTLALGKASSHDEVALFQREGQVLHHLSHPRLPRVLATFEEERDGDVLLHQVRAYVEGRSLLEEARDGKHLTEREALLTTLGVARTLAFLHQRSPALVHRDIKPQNLIRLPADHGCRPDDDVAVIDLGAIKAGPHTGQTVVGTYGYMPPEQYEGQASPRSDVYALGMTLIFLVTHKEPGEFGDDGARAGFRRHANVSEPCAALIDRMIAFDPAARFSDGQALADAIEALLDPRAVAHAAASTPPSRRAASGPALLVALAVLVALLAVGAAALLLGTEPTPEPFVADVQPPPVPPPVPPSPPTVPRPKVGPLGLSALEGDLRCAHRLLPRVFASEARYLSWVDPTKGPTGNERHIYGLYEAYDDAIEHCAGAPPVAALAARLLPRLEEAARYYDEEDYKDDKFAKGRALHQPLLDDFAALRPHAKELERRIGAHLKNATASEDPAIGAILIALRAAWGLAAAAPRAGDALDPARLALFESGYKVFERALEEAQRSPLTPRTYRSYLVERLEHHRTWAKRLLRSYQEGRSRVDRSNGWDPDEVIATTLGLLVDVLNIERANHYTW